VLRRWWAAHGTAALRGAVGIMAVLALLKLGDEFRRLLWDAGPSGAVDLKHLHDVVQRWFVGGPVYSELDYAVHPPATYLMLWPFLGWLELTPARWLWAATSLVALGWMTHLIVEESGADTRLERAFVALLLLSMNATGVTIGNGQLTLHVLLALLAALLLLYRNRDGWRDHVLAAALMLVALMKLSVSMPFLWLVLFSAGGLPLAVLIAGGYVALTLGAVCVQEVGLSQLIREWLARGSALAGSQGYANLHAGMSGLGLERWMLPASLLVFAALGMWTYRYRHADLWLLLGVSALVARFWVYHRVYDDMLVLLPMVALFRVAKRGPCADGADVAAAVLLAISVMAMLAPARLGFETSPWVRFFNVGHTLVWLTVLLFLLDRARREKTAVMHRGGRIFRGKKTSAMRSAQSLQPHSGVRVGSE
jgi:hypothetical protein